MAGCGSGEAKRTGNHHPGEQLPRHAGMLARFAKQDRGASSASALQLRAPFYEVGTGADLGAAAAASLLRRNSTTDATAIQSSQTIIVKKMIEKIAATPAT